MFDQIVVTHIDGIYSVPSMKGRFLQMENRVDYGLSFCKSGQITYTQNSTRYISDKNCAIIIPQGANYTLCGDESGVFPLINFRVLSPFSDTFIKIDLENPEVYIKDVNKMQGYLSKGDTAKAFSVIYEIFDRLKNESKENNVLAPVIKYMENHLSDDDLNNSRLAATLNISEVYFRQLFKKHYGTTPHKYLQTLRIERSKQLLADGNLSVSQIAEVCGFSGVYYFCKTFKAFTGSTPTSYRKSLERLEL